MRAMRTYAKKKEHANEPIGPFTMFSYCAYGYNIRNELISAAKSVEGDDPSAPQSRTLNTMEPDPIVFPSITGSWGLSTPLPETHTFTTVTGIVDIWRSRRPK